MNQPRRVFIQNFGCQMNDYDVARLTEVLRRDGYERTEVSDEADLVYINTCSIREKAEAKVASAAGAFREWKKKPGAILAIGGCVAQQEGPRLLRRIQHADLTLGPDQIVNVPSLLRQVQDERRRIAATDVIDVEDYTFLDADPRPGDLRVTALVTIQKGCDNHCAFCVVPHTRGREVSRPAAEVVAEVKRFVALGAREITLIGQNVNSYHAIGTPDGDDFAALLAQVDRVPGLARLRFTTSHPKDFTPRVAEAFRDLPRLCAWLHLPVQSGSSRTLRRMVRGYTREQYLAKVDHLRALVPEIALTTDIIVGYPGETDAEFAETLSLLATVGYDSIYSFEYSERPDTPALKLLQRDDVLPSVKHERLMAVQALQRDITARRLAAYIGRQVEVLVEGESRSARGGGGQACGRTSGNHMVNFATSGRTVAELTGLLVHVRIDHAGTNTLAGTLSPGATPAIPGVQQARSATNDCRGT
ncbi:MAG: tRNA (N6-isopentenyl adenosine(37)-C2)-methylthiotransferase MiaB [Myxococcales bacterium]|nr:tRNA (N6-isopentenyl adenosine(37)-C2)-methylthiotransferase MiaB [Myxococcales bacterium]